MKRTILLSIYMLVVYAFSWAQDYKVVEHKGKQRVYIGEQYIDQKFDAVYACSGSDLHLIAQKNLNHWLINVETAAIYPVYSNLEEYLYEDTCFVDSTNKLKMRWEGKMGLYRFPEQVIVPPKFANVVEIDETENIVILDGFDGKTALYFVDKGEQTLWYDVKDRELQFNYDNGIAYPDITACFGGWRDGRFYLVQWTGTEHEIINLPKKFDDRFFSDSYQQFPTRHSDGKVAYIDVYGRLLTDYVYDDAHFFVDDYAIVKKGGKWGLVDDGYRPEIPFIYDGIERSKSWTFYVKTADKQAEVDETGAPLAFEMAFYCAKDGKFGYNYHGKKRMAIPCQFDFAETFVNGFAAVNRGGKYNPETEEVVGGKWGYIAPTGQLVIDYIYDRALQFDVNRKALVTLNGQEFYIDIYGRRID